MKNDELERQAEEFFVRVLMISTFVCGLCVIGFFILRGGIS